MRLGSFSIDNKAINVEHNDYNHIDGVTYKFLEAASGKELAVTTYRGVNVAEGVSFTEAALQDGLRKVLRQSARA